MNGQRVHVSSRGPRGWNAVVLFVSGTVFTVTDDHGRRHLVDTSKTTVRVLSPA